MIFREMTDSQRRVFIDTIQLHETFIAAFNKNRSYRGGMHWKKSKGREYLFRSRDRFGYGKSLGLRSPETEKILAQFQQGKQRDHDQGLAVAKLVMQYLPQYRFNTSELRMFPKNLVQEAKKRISEFNSFLKYS